MVKRRFELPSIQDLSKEQEAVRALPKEGQHLIVGGPGTGKSVLALIRARRHQRDGDEYLFLVFNHLLHQASIQLFGNGLVSDTWEHWFRKIFRDIAGKPVPLLEPNHKGYQGIDWDGVEKIAEALPKGKVGKRLFLVIDEGQDMPPHFYSALIDLDFEQFFVVADQNQQITELNSSRKAIEDGLAIDPANVIELRQNYRNNYHVARLAREFYTGDPASPPPELPAAKQGVAPLLYYYEEANLDKVGQGILQLADRKPRQLIGVIAPNNQVRQRYFDLLSSVEARLDNPRPPIKTFHAEHRANIAFDEGGILVINAQACKGLEFDTVVLADIDGHYFRYDDPDATKRVFYVMVARARERVFMFMKRDGNTRIENILPKDRDVLRCKDL